MKKLKQFFNVFLQMLAFQRPAQNLFHQHSDFDFSSQSLTVPSKYEGSIRKLFKKCNGVIATSKEEAIQMGLQSKGDNPVPPTEPTEAFAAMTDVSVVEVLTSMENDKATLRQELAPVAKRLEKPMEDRVRVLDQKRRDELNELMEKHLEDAGNDTTELEEDIISAARDYDFHEGQRLIAYKRIGRIPIKGMLDKMLPLGLMTGGMIGIDIGIIKYAFEALRFATDAAIMIGGAIAFVVAYSASRMGDGFAHQNRFDFKTGLTLGLFSIAAISIIRFIGTARKATWDTAQKVAESGAELGMALVVDHTVDFFMLGLNLLLWFTAFGLEAKRHLRAAYFGAEKKRDEALDRKKEAQKILNIKRLASPHKELRIRERYESEILIQAHAEHDRDTSEKVRLESGINTISDIRGHFLRDVEKIKEYAIKTFNEHFQIGVANRRPDINGFFGHAVIVSAIAISIASGGCGTVENMVMGEPEHIKIILGHDTTIDSVYQNVVNTPRLNEYLTDDVLKFRSEELPRTQVDIYTIVVNDLAIPSYHLAASLEEGEPKATRVLYDRIDSINVFLKTLKTVTEKLFVNSNGMDKSEVNQCLCRGLNKLSQSPATKKFFIVHSDFMENSKISFHSIETGSISGEMYEEIAEAFSKACPLGDLTGIEVVGFYTPPREIQDKVLDAQAFWKKYLESHGSKVSFVPNF